MATQAVHRDRRHRCLALIGVLAASLATGPVRAADVQLSGVVAVARPSGAVGAVLGDPAGLILPQAGSAQDPTLQGAELRVLDTDGALGLGAGDFVHPLPARGWRALGSPPGSRGYLYRGNRAADDVCRRVWLGPTSVRFSCRGRGFGLRPPFRGAAGMIVGVPATDDSAAIRYCAELGGSTLRNDARRFIRYSAPAPTACPSVRPPPNFIVINLDDARVDGLDRMPVLQRLAAEGVTFRQSFVGNAVCTPSRASILSGLYSIHHGTRAVGGALGGADTFRQSGADRQTIAVWLHDVGYTTGLFGKYLNEYGASEAHAGPGGTFYIPPGWDRWRAQIGFNAYGGVLGGTYEILDESRTRTLYADHTSDAQYATDLLGQWVRDFVTDAVGAQRPFFAYWTPYASHGDPLAPAPAIRHAGRFAGLAPWRPASFDEADVSDKPRWLHLLTPGGGERALTDDIRERAYESLLAVDEQLGLLLDHLTALGIDDRTMVLLTSDNGVSWGEHRLFAQEKEAPYEECIRVPMVARYPRGERAGVAVDAAVLNIDVAPTLLALAGLPPHPGLDGRSFSGLVGGAGAPASDDAFLLEHFRWARSHGLTYSGQVTDGDRVRLFHGDSLVRPRESTLFEFDDDGSIGDGAMAVPIGGTDDGSFANLAAAIVAAVVQVQAVPAPSTKRLDVADRPPSTVGVYLRPEVDQGEVMEEDAVLPDYVGVRDVANGYTYVEYETNEVELYDLHADPAQLENRAADPAYTSLRNALAVRLDLLLPAR